MLVPLSWLREFTPYEGSASELGERLTMLGLELEEIVNPFAAIMGIKTGFVAQCDPHPDSDHLHCCKVDMGNGEILDIVCGAPNVAAGQKVAVAPVGATLPDGTVIKKAKLRGQTSCGMICSERELGLSDDHTGILVLPESTAIGQRLVDAMEMDCEVLDLSITPNRPDCLSILGVARETASAFGLPFHVPDLPFETDSKSGETILPIEIEDPELCWQYGGRVIEGIKVAPSPHKMRYRLIAVGVRPISNIVDVTNYILFECGQPLHSFDLDKLSGGRIIVKCAKDGEKFTTLDGRERMLNKDDLCICDANAIVGLAGVMGGLDTEITAQSHNVFLESAVFQPRSIRKTSRRLGLTSEASYRFERGIDQMRSIWALDRACALMASISGGLINPGLSLEIPKPFKSARIAYAPAQANALLGVTVANGRQKEILESLGCAIENSEAEVWTVIQPSWRPDLTRPADVIEEVGRYHGLDSIPPELPPVHRNLADCFFGHSTFSFWNLVRDWGAGVGLNEAINYSFVGQTDLDFLNLPPDNRITVFNPLSEDQNVLRTCLAPGLLHDLANNLAYGAQSVKLFELANTFHADPSSETGATESGVLGILLYGLRHDSGWPHADGTLDYADIKGLVEHLCHFLNLPKPLFTRVEDHPWLMPCVQITVGNEKPGFLGKVKTDIADAFHAVKNVWICELGLDALQGLHEKAMRRFHSLPIFPAIRRDMTVIADKKIHAGSILERILLQKLPLLEGAVLVDCFEPSDSDERHLTYRLTFRHHDRTLKDSEADKEREKVAANLRKSIGVKI